MIIFFTFLFSLFLLSRINCCKALRGRSLIYKCTARVDILLICLNVCHVSNRNTTQRRRTQLNGKCPINIVMDKVICKTTANDSIVNAACGYICRLLFLQNEMIIATEYILWSSNKWDSEISVGIASTTIWCSNVKIFRVIQRRELLLESSRELNTGVILIQVVN